jgi:hypothetical protein
MGILTVFPAAVGKTAPALKAPDTKASGTMRQRAESQHPIFGGLFPNDGENAKTNPRLVRHEFSLRYPSMSQLPDRQLWFPFGVSSRNAKSRPLAFPNVT